MTVQVCRGFFQESRILQSGRWSWNVLPQETAFIYDMIMVCALKLSIHWSGSNISCMPHHWNKVIFKLCTLRPNGLNINFNFLWLCFKCVLHIYDRKHYYGFHICCSMALLSLNFLCIRSFQTEEGLGLKPSYYLTLWKTFFSLMTTNIV